jgi:hypothetical protein
MLKADSDDFKPILTAPACTGGREYDLIDRRIEARRSIPLFRGAAD